MLRLAEMPELAPVQLQLIVKKKGAQSLPILRSATRSLRSGYTPRRALDLPSVQAAGAHLDLRDLAVDDNPGDLKIRLPGAPRLVVRVREVGAVGDALVAHVAAVSLDLRHIVNLRSA